MTVSIDDYINNFNSTHAQFSVTEWIHDHPTAVKVAQVAGLVLGIIAIAGLCLFASALPVGIVIGVGLVAGLGIVGSIVSWLFLKYVSCEKYERTLHAYQEMSCEGGSLYYRGDIPVLEFVGDDAKKWGYAHGFLFGSTICKLKKNLDLAVHSIMRLPHSENLSHVLRAVRDKVPLEYLNEMEGLAEGYRAWAVQTGASLEITQEEFLLMHLIPDSKHFHPQVLEKELRALAQAETMGAMACTSLLDRDDEGNVIFGRNMDWCPFGEGGSKSLVMVWKNKGVAILGVPGFIGAVTGWNRDRVALAMNVCPGETTKVAGMPAILFNRHVLESVTTVSEGHALMDEEQPLGPYHLTIADPKEGSCVSFHQENGRNHRRDLADKYIEVLNWEYPKCEGGFFNSHHRHGLIAPYFEQAQAIPNRHPQLMENILQLSPYINSWITMHSLLFRPAHNKVKMNWDNGYAASAGWAESEMTAFF